MAGEHAVHDRVGPGDDELLGQLMAAARNRGLSDRLGQLHRTLLAQPGFANRAGERSGLRDWRRSVDRHVQALAAQVTADPGGAVAVAYGGPDTTAPTALVTPDGDVCWPVSPEPKGPAISSGFGPRRAPVAGASTLHNGSDFVAPKGAAIRSSQAGEVMMVGPRGRGGDTIIVQNADGSISGYAHTGATQGLEVGDWVGACQVIGFSNNSGKTTGPHLHYTYRPGTMDTPATLSTPPVNPMTTQFGDRSKVR